MRSNYQIVFVVYRRLDVVTYLYHNTCLTGASIFIGGTNLVPHWLLVFFTVSRNLYFGFKRAIFS
jgi:hypothetical protein